MLTVKCRSCGLPQQMAAADVTAGIRARKIEDRGYTDARPNAWATPADRMLFNTCGPCRLSEAHSVLALGQQLARISDGRKRLEATGMSRAEAISKAVESQMDEDERRRFPDFYHWRRECPPAEPATFRPPVAPAEQGTGSAW